MEEEITLRVVGEDVSNPSWRRSIPSSMSVAVGSGGTRETGRTASAWMLELEGSRSRKRGAVVE